MAEPREDLSQTGIHFNGQIWSRALWDIRNRLGSTIADTVIFEAQFAFSRDTSMPEAARATVATARRLYGNATADVVEAEFDDRGIL